MLEKDGILHEDRIRHVFIQLYDGVVLGYGVVLDEDGWIGISSDQSLPV